MKKLSFLLLFFVYWQSPVLANEWGLTVGLTGQKFNYNEFDDQGTSLLSENGIIPGINFLLGYHQHNYFLSTRINYFRGSVDYDGQTQSGLPLQSITNSELGSWDSSVGWYVINEVSVFLRLSKHYWNRDIQATDTSGRLFEHYSWNQAGVGMQIRYDFSPKSSLNLHGVLSKTHNPEVLVDLRPYGGENVLLELGSEQSIELGYEWVYRVSPSFALGLGAKYQKYRFGESDSKITFLNSSIVSISEPSSNTEILNISLFLRFFL